MSEPLIEYSPGEVIRITALLRLHGHKTPFLIDRFYHEHPEDAQRRWWGQFLALARLKLGYSVAYDPDRDTLEVTLG